MRENRSVLVLTGVLITDVHPRLATPTIHFEFGSGTSVSLD